MEIRWLALGAALTIVPVTAHAAAPFVVTETGRSFYRLDDAVKALGGGDGTITVAPGTYRDCAIVTGGNVTIRAVTPSTAIFDGGACEGKATLVLRGASATVDGLVFQNIRVPDRNGAGIRLEQGDLTVVRATFRNSEQGILTASDLRGSIRVERSTFSGLGGCPDGMCSHSIYVGRYGKLSVVRSRFERGTGGHYVKSRATVTEVIDSSFDDSKGRETNYMIDLPSGSIGLIARNIFVQGVSKENYSAFIAVAPEGRDSPSAGLRVEGNEASIAPGVKRQTVFVADWSREPLKLGANTLGPGIKAFELR
ncbi:MAG: right-handed parallel beta-helix repeat-containing protein [Sphingomonadaceae bacterium]